MAFLSAALLHAPSGRREARVRGRRASALASSGVGAGLMALVTALVTTAPPASALTSGSKALTSVTVQGYGFGHGRGMGQWGAFGYASVYHWSYQRILAHYYGGTRLGSVAESGTQIPVLLSELRGKTLKVQALPGQSLVGEVPGGRPVVAGALEVIWRAGVPALYSGTSCSGAWRPVAGASAATTTTSAPGAQAVTVSAASTGAPVAATNVTTGAAAGGALEVCLPGTGVRQYAGRVLAEPNGNVFNVLPLEQYVDGVVPAESPESWAEHGGQAALEAQAVAARSYALASVAAQGFVCDNTQCQMYLGVPDQYGPTADAAVAATAGQVLYCLPATTCGPAGTVALAEYSASTGGYSAGGAFPAVVDQGDAVATNPVHSWTVTLTPARLQKAFPSLGGVTSLSVTARNGLGPLGGRALSVHVQGREGGATVAGYEFAALLGLPSNWFAFAGSGGSSTTAPATTAPAATVPATTVPATTVPATTVPATTVPATTTTTGPTTTGPTTTGPTTTGPTTTGPSTSVTATTAPAGTPLGARAPAPASSSPVANYWVVTAQGDMVVAGKAPLFGTALGTPLQGKVAGMAASSRQQGYWIAGKNGAVLAFGHAHWYGSASGHHLRGPVVAITATPDGRGYWLACRDGGVFAFGDAHFFGSIGATSSGAPVVGMAATPDGQGYWLVTSDGGVFPFGDAGFYGSPAQGARARPVAGIVGVPGGKGYFLIARDGGVFAYGSARYAGSLPAEGLRALVVAVAAAPRGSYVMLTSTGSLYEFSRAAGAGPGAVGEAGLASVTSQDVVAMALDRG